MTADQHRAMALAIRRACFDSEGRRVRGLDAAIWLNASIAVLGDADVARVYGEIALGLWRVRVSRAQQ